MKYYVEITLLPDAELNVYHLWERVYQQVHLALVEQKSANNRTSIGVSFPEYNLERHSLGRKLRLFANTEMQLQELNIKQWLNRLSDYVHCKEVKSIPSDVSRFGCFKRLFEKGNNERLARRRSKRLSISYEDALAYFESDSERKRSLKSTSQYPFITMKSLSTGEKYPLSIALIAVEILQFEDGYSTFGLSSSSSVPLF